MSNFAEIIVKELLDDEYFVNDCKKELNEIMKDGKFDTNDLPELMQIVVLIFLSVRCFDSSSAVSPIRNAPCRYGNKAVANFFISCPLFFPPPIQITFFENDSQAARVEPRLVDLESFQKDISLISFTLNKRCGYGR